ncbi:MAG: 4-hydroxy-3-methylbut-2-enyl diphosphate reductase [Clostridia bacterium]
MKIIIGKESGFCFGVRRAVEGVKEECKKRSKINCLGEIVHNEVVVNDLKQNGVRFVENIEDVKDGELLAIRAHGVEEKVYKRAKEKKLEIIDYTCPKVMNIHRKIKEEYENGNNIILIGKKDHPETIGSKGYAKDVYVIENIDEIKNLPEMKNVFSIVQTTFSYSKYLEIEKALKEKYKDINSLNTICPSTKNRQEECRKISSEVEFMIIIGGKNSSNTKKLYDVACSECENCIIIQDENDKKIEECKKYDIIGVMSGASTPMETIKNVVNKINNIK